MERWSKALLDERTKPHFRFQPREPDHFCIGQSVSCAQ